MDQQGKNTEGGERFMSQEKIVSNEERPLLYPSIKQVNIGREIRMEIVKNGILPKTAKDAIYFRVDYRFDRTVIDSLALKYSASADNYPTDSGEEQEHFLLGSTACEDSASDMPSCPYLRKVWEVLQKGRVSRKKVIAIYLLGLDDKEDNEQKFIALAKDKFYLRWETLKLQHVDYQDVSFDDNGIRSKRLIPGLEGENDGYLLARSLDERFLRFAQEIHLLKAMILSGIDVTHPMLVLSKDKRLQYFKFLVTAAAGARNLNARRLLYLEYLAREFRISAEELKRELKSALRGKMSDHSMANSFSALEQKVIPVELFYVFYQDLLDVSTSDTGEAEWEKLHSLVKKSAGDTFVRDYCHFLRARREAERYLGLALRNVKYPELRLEAMYRLQRYSNALKLQTLKTGVKIDG